MGTRKSNYELLPKTITEKTLEFSERTPPYHEGPNPCQIGYLLVIKLPKIKENQKSKEIVKSYIAPVGKARAST